MKNFNILASIALATAITFSSCTVEKRVHMNGYHVEWHNSKDKSGPSEEAATTPSSELAEIETSAAVTIPSTSEKVIANVSSSNLSASAVEEIVVLEPTSETPQYTAPSADLKEAAKASKKEIKASVKSFVKEAKKEAKAAGKQSGSGGKSQLIALILVALVGGLGIHRFYLGYIGIGVVQLLTLGGCGIWALIDLIRIITGDLQPKDGTYEKTL